MTRSESLTDEKGWLLEDDSWEVMRKEDVMDDHADIVRAAVEVQIGLATLMQTVLYGRTMILIDTILDLYLFIVDTSTVMDNVCSNNGLC